MSNVNGFLSLYKSYETLVRDAGDDPKELEDAADGLTGGRLRMCRLFRNYLSHSEDRGFLEPTDRMVGFLEGQVKDLRMKGDVAKKHLKTVAASMVTDKDRCADAVQKMSDLKRDRLVMQTKGGFVLVSMYDVVPLVMASKAAKLSVAKVLKEKPCFVGPLEPVAGLDRSRTYVCTSDGTPSGKVLGTVIL